MNKLREVRAKVVSASSGEGNIGDNPMRIPGMDIGTANAVKGPSMEDVMWLANKVEICTKFMKEATYTNEVDMHLAKKLIKDVEEGQ